MINQIIITPRDPNNWDNTEMIITGITRHGRTVNSQKTKFNSLCELPITLKQIWDEAVLKFKTYGRGDWIAARVIVKKETRFIIPNNSNNINIQEETTVQEETLFCEILAHYEDDTSQELTLELSDKSMIAFFDTVTSDDFWLNSQDIHI